MVNKRQSIALLSILCCALLVLFAARSQAQVTHAGKLIVKGTGFQSAEGNVLFQVRSGPNTVAATQMAEVDTKTRTAQVVFENLPAGVYGVSVIHDANKNGQLDFDSVGMPVEGYGHSNNPAKREGPPSFDETKFTLGAADVTTEIQLIYWP